MDSSSSAVTMARPTSDETEALKSGLASKECAGADSENRHGLQLRASAPGSLSSAPPIKHLDPVRGVLKQNFPLESLYKNYEPKHVNNTEGGNPDFMSHTSKNFFLTKKNLLFGEKEKETDHQRFRCSEITKAANLASLSQALGCMDQFRKSQVAGFEKPADKETYMQKLVTNLSEVCQEFNANSSKRNEVSETLSLEHNHGSDSILDLAGGSSARAARGGFSCAVCMTSGSVVSATASLAAVLGYPTDMWVGRNITDFLHPEDKDNFVSQVSENMKLPIENIRLQNTRNKSCNFFSRICMYSALKSGFAVMERQKVYRFLKMCVCFREVNRSDVMAKDVKVEEDEVGIYMFVTAVPLTSPYKSPCQPGPLGEFITKHNTECVWTFLDEDVVSLLGHFPHELLNREIFDIIHPHDLNIVMETFESLVTSKGITSKCYRMKTRNCDYVTVTSTWKMFLNPWTQHLEFIQGSHRVLRGPENPNIFSESTLYPQEENPTEDAIDVKDIIQSDIKQMLQNYARKSSILQIVSGTSLDEKKKLKRFVNTILEGITSRDNNELRRSCEAVVKGTMCPRLQDTGPPPSYRQLNYNENITRFFNSQPKTLVEQDIVSSLSSYEDKPPPRVLKRRGGNSRSGTSQTVTLTGSGDPDLQSSSSVIKSSSTNRKSSLYLLRSSASQPMFASSSQMDLSSGGLVQGSEEDREEPRPPLLTEERMLMHNREMERQMVTKFRQGRNGNFIKLSKTGSSTAPANKHKMENVKDSETSRKQDKSSVNPIPNNSLVADHPCPELPLSLTDSTYSGTTTPHLFVASQSGQEPCNQDTAPHVEPDESISKSLIQVL